MKKSTIIILSVVLVALLGLATYTTVLFSGNNALQPCCPAAANNQPYYQAERGNDSGFGMMGSMNVFIDSEFKFLVHMIPHHEEAVATATYLKDNTEREEIKRFAEDIIRTQTAEIAQMILFLDTWYPGGKYEIDYQPMMREFEGLQGDVLDRAFLEDMIPHHMTAVMMSQQLLNLGLAEHEEVETLAGSIRNSQSNEIQLMMNWLNNWNRSVPLPATRNLAALIWVGVLALVVFVALAILLIRIISAGKLAQDNVSNQAQGLLEKRYARGEITREVYLETRRDLEN